jgi:hypothetical protein
MKGLERELRGLGEILVFELVCSIVHQGGRVRERARVPLHLPILS